jgi:hypothetical protein
MASMGELHDEGKGVTKDYLKALEWYQKAADRGSPEALFKLGQMYYEGTGVAKDLKKALDFTQKAADQGYKDAVLRFWQKSKHTLGQLSAVPHCLVMMNKQRIG